VGVALTPDEYRERHDMALTPEDVVNKRFQPTKFREGYDQDEVDDFLDEIVLELRRLNLENDDLKLQLAAAEARLSGGKAATGPAPDARNFPAAKAPEPMQPLIVPTGPDGGSSNDMLQLARRLHEEHVREGIEKRDALIAEGHAAAARILADAEASGKQLAANAEVERSALEQRVGALRAFEAEYRARLRAYIEGQLTDLNTTAIEPA